MRASLSNNQLAYQPRLSTTDGLLHMVDDWNTDYWTVTRTTRVRSVRLFRFVEGLRQARSLDFTNENEEIRLKPQYIATHGGFSARPDSLCACGKLLK